MCVCVRVGVYIFIHIASIIYNRFFIVLVAGSEKSKCPLSLLLYIRNVYVYIYIAIEILARNSLNDTIHKIFFIFHDLWANERDWNERLVLDCFWCEMFITSHQTIDSMLK